MAGKAEFIIVFVAGFSSTKPIRNKLSKVPEIVTFLILKQMTILDVIKKDDFPACMANSWQKMKVHGISTKINRWKKNPDVIRLLA